VVSHTGNVRLDWELNNGAAVQLEYSTNLASGFAPLSPVTNGTSFIDMGALAARPQTFYRLRQP
jgi:hypothetical protein